MDVQSFHFRGGEIDNINFAKVLMLLSQNREEAGNTFRKRVFECKTCNRQFSSFQALGGHRASHKKPRLPEDSQGSNAEALKPKVHGCSICGLEFAIGQALGGHMRRHRTSGPRRFGHRIVEKNANGKRVLLFDLNSVPEGEGEEDIIECQDIIECREVMEVELGLGLGLGHGAVEKRPMVDCIH